jgi:hypothetical protein
MTIRNKALRVLFYAAFVRCSRLSSYCLDVAEVTQSLTESFERALVGKIAGKVAAMTLLDEQTGSVQLRYAGVLDHATPHRDF